MSKLVNPIAEGVGVFPVRTPTLPPATHTNVWVLGDHHVIVVDPASPYPEEQERLDEAMEMFMVEKIFLTHHHLDHVGGAEDLRDRTGAPIAAHALTAERVGFAVDEIIEDGDMLATDAGFWKALHTPGHATGHLCLHHPGLNMMVAGDMVAGIGTILLDPPEGNLGLYLDSLAQLKALSPGMLLPAHGPPIEDGVGCLQEYIDHRNMRTDQVLRTLREHPGAQPSDLVPHIYAELPTSFHGIAARQILCHLQWLLAQQSVSTDGEHFSVAE
jgi:glyoxylase-like metal-dependent hydrolase (beta-lactamase superfamily II)